MFEDITIIEKSFALLVSKVKYDEVDEEKQYVTDILKGLQKEA